MEPITTTTPPKSHKPDPTRLIKSASKLTQMDNNGSENEENQIPNFTVEFIPKGTTPLSATPPSKLSIKPRTSMIPLHELLLMSPPVRKSKARLSDRLEMADEAAVSEPRRKCNKGGRTSLNGGSPRNLRRSSRRRVEHEDNKDVVQLEEVVKPTRKRRHTAKSKKDKNSSVPSASNDCIGEESALDRLGQMGWELVMWSDVAKSSLWFGFGCLCFLSSCFTKGLNISLFSVVSQLGLLFLAASFISNTLLQRENAPTTREVKLTDDDILRVTRVVLPALNLVISKTRELFSGEPATTLKVAILFLFGAEYGHLLTVWRLCTLGFFASFTGPKLYSSYSAQIQSKVEQYQSRVFEAWGACSHKKIVALSVATAFWNLSSLRTRVFAAFVSLVILRYYRQHLAPQLDKEEVLLESQAVVEEQEKEEAEHEQEQAQPHAVAEGKGVVETK